nr:MAG TPA: hypothetical protein [Caudoviricetes sp.]
MPMYRPSSPRLSPADWRHCMNCKPCTGRKTCTTFWKFWQ